MYSECVHNRGGMLEHCTAFLDGTRIQMVRPEGSHGTQRSVYSGHKYFHCLSYQTLTTPDGLIFHIYIPFEGRLPDISIYNSSGLDAMLEEHSVVNGFKYYVYGDKAYLMKLWLIIAYRSSEIESEDHVLFNTSMNKVRTSVEWSYSELKQYYTTQDFPRKLLVRKLPLFVL